mgnify:CR=1 FL=1
MSLAVILFLTAASGVTACMTVLAAFGGGVLLVAAFVALAVVFFVAGNR